MQMTTIPTYTPVTDIAVWVAFLIALAIPGRSRSAIGSSL